MVSIDFKAVSGFVPQKVYESALSDAFKAFDLLHGATGAGNDFLGWVDLPSRTNEALVSRIDAVAKRWKNEVEAVVVIGIGGSYLGAKCVTEALSGAFHSHAKGEFPHILFAGHNICEDYMGELLEYLQEREFAIVVVSKSGTTTEPAIAFRLLRTLLERKIGVKASAGRIVAVTDASKGALRMLSNENGYQTFTVPDNVGGRYSVLTPVGLRPIALAGFDIRALIAGASVMEKNCRERSELNPALSYALMRNALYRSGKKIEILVNYNPKLQYFSEWWKQLYGESEGKEGKGIFPASVSFTTDLHSMGQYIQDGERTIFETCILVEENSRRVTLGSEENDGDGLNYLAGKRMGWINSMAQLGTMLAHVEGGVPNILFKIKRIDECNIGELVYLFEAACGISGYMLGVNPFDQPGVEAYKRNMFALLGKPGYEEASAELKKKI